MAIIGQLLVRLGMDSSGFDRGTKKTKKSLYDIQKDSAKAQQQMLRWAKIGAAFGVAVLAVRRLSNVLRASIRAAAEDEDTRNQLIASLRESAHATNEQIASIDNYTSRAERMFRMTDTEVRALAAQAAALGIPAEIINEVTEAAIGLGKALRVDARTAMVNLARTLQGDVTIWKRYGISVSESTNKMEVVREVMQKAAAGVEQAKAEMSGMTGSLHNLEMAWGDLHEEIGRTIGPEFIATSQAAIRAIDDLRLAVGILNKEFRNVRENWELLFRNASGPAGNIGSWSVKRDVAQFNELGKQLDETIRKFNEFNQAKEEAAAEADSPAAPGLSATDEYARQQIQQKNLQDVMMSYMILRKQREELERIGGTYQTSAQYAKIKQQIETATTDNTERRASLMRQMDEEFQGIENAKRLKKAYDEMESTFKSNINAMIWEGQTFKDSMINVVKAITAELINMLIVEKAARAMAGGITSFFGIATSAASAGMSAAGTSSSYSGIYKPGGSYASPMHAGGIVGMPRLHGGLAPDEYSAILQRGEAVTPKGGLKATVNIINNTGQPMKGRVKGTEFDGRKFVTSVILDDLSSNGQVRQALEGIQK